MKESHFIKVNLTTEQDSIIRSMYEVNDNNFDYIFEKIMKSSELYNGEYIDDMIECIQEAKSNQEDVSVKFGDFSFSIEWFDAKYDITNGLLEIFVSK